MKNLKEYEQFLDYISPVIDKKFENQKEYIFCSNGCDLCCRSVTMPFCEIEFNYLLEGLKSLPENKQKIVFNNIKKISDNSNNNQEKVCPFLIDKSCSVYKYRGIICRIFGLLIYNTDGEYTIPFCVHSGLNYSNVYDEKTQKISSEKYYELGLKNEPVFSSLTRQNIFNLSLVKDLGIELGESKPLIEWLNSYYSQIL